MAPALAAEEFRRPAEPSAAAGEFGWPPADRSAVAERGGLLPADPSAGEEEFRWPVAPVAVVE